MATAASFLKYFTLFILLHHLPAITSALPSTSKSIESRDFTVGNSVVDLPVFQNKLQLDVVTVLLLLGETTIWKIIWTRFRFRRSSWKQRLYAIAPGWAPMAGSVFASMQAARGPSNLIYDRPPTEAINARLMVTNLNSGASHAAENVILQNVYQAWARGPRGRHRVARTRESKGYEIKREVGIVDVDIDKMRSPGNWPLYLQCSCLLVQITISLVLGLLGLSLEVFTVFLVALTAQGLLLTAVTPRKAGWDHRDLTVHKSPPLMFHMGMDSTSILFVRSARKDGRLFSLEEYCWESQTLRNYKDVLKMIVAGLSFLVFAFQLILIGWMSAKSRLLFLILGSLGLVANAIEGAMEPDWEHIFSTSYSGDAFCEPRQATTMAAVGVLLAGKFSAGESVSKLLYPDNARFDKSRADFTEVFDNDVCVNCQRKINFNVYAEENSPQNVGCLKVGGELCSAKLEKRVGTIESKQIKDGVATVCHFLRLGTEEEDLPRVETEAKKEDWNWGTNG